MAHIPNPVNIGTVLINTATGDNLGAVVNIIPSTKTVILFRVDKKVHPTFSKIGIADLVGNTITPAGNINNSQYGDLKLQLLKYYRTRNLSPVERRVLDTLMQYSFPNGIPLYNTEAILQDDTVRHLGIRDKIRAGASFYLNTSETSKFPHLDNKMVWVIKQDEKGIWVCDDLKCITQPAFSYIPYKDAEIPTFYGISKMLSSTSSNPNQENDFQALKGVFDKMASEKALLSQIVHDNIRMKVDPTQDNMILMPHKYSGQCFDFGQGRVCSVANIAKSANDARAMIYDNEPILDLPANNKSLTPGPSAGDLSGPIQLDMIDEDPAMIAWMDKLDAFKSHERTKLDPAEIPVTIQLGGGSNPQDPGVIVDDDMTQLMALDGSTSRSSPKDQQIDGDARTEGDELANSDFSDFEELEETLEIQEVGQFQKVRVLPVPELMRTFKDSIQRGQIQKQKIERLPALLRENDYFVNKIKKEVNIISLIKSQVTLENKTVKLPIPDYKPLVEQYMNRNFAHNNFLIPLVISTRKLFLTKKDKVSPDDFSTTNSQVTPDFYKHIADIEKEKQTGGTRKLINLDEELGKQTIIQAPYLAHQSSIGMLIRLGEKIDTEAGQNQDTTPKLKVTRAREHMDLETQETLVIQYGQKPYEIDNFGLDKSPYDSFVAMGPLRRFMGEESSEMTTEQLEAMEDQIDRNIEVISSDYKVYYYGDNINLVGFVRPPIKYMFSGDNSGHHGINIGDASIREDLINDDNVIVRNLHKLRSQQESSQDRESGQSGGGFIDDEVGPLDDPDKYIMYLFPGLIPSGQKKAKEINMNETRLKRYLDRAIPTIQQITELYNKTWSVNNSADIHRLIDILAQFDYYYQDIEAQMSIKGRGLGHTGKHNTYNNSKLSYPEYSESIGKLESQLVTAMTEYSNKMDKIIKLKAYKAKKTNERDSLAGKDDKSSSAKVITDDIIELADKIYGEKFSDISGNGFLSKTDEYRLDYYANQEPDKGRLMNILLKQKVYKEFEAHNSKETLENTLFVLKSKFESLSASNNNALLNSNLAPELANKLKECNTRLDRKPKIIKYPTVERLKQDNGKVITNTRGEVIISGDFAVVEEESGQKLVFKREQLVEGDYWISQPISVLESLLLKKKKADCESGLDETKRDELRAKMRLPGEQLTDTDTDPAKKKTLSDAEIDKCTFNPDKLSCLPAELSSADEELRELEARIKDVKAELDYVINVPVFLSENNKGLQQIESNIRAYNTGLTELNKFYEAKHFEEQRMLEALIKRRRDCSHFQVVDYLFALVNLTDLERLGLAKQIIDRFQNTEQVDNLVLDLLDGQDSKNNNLECYICNQTLLCKHYAYAIKLVEESPNGILDEVALVSVYGEEMGQSYYCKVCGAHLGNTEVLDVEEFEKVGDKEGMHVKTREVLEDINIIEKQKQAIATIMEDALQGGDDKEDLKFKLRIFKLMKELCGIHRFTIDDELDMVNFLKTYSSGITRKALHNLFALTFQKAGKQVATAVIDKLAEAEYWKYVTGDIMCRFLVILQTSRAGYTVYNKILSSEFMGWPLLGGGNKEAEPAGIDLLFGCAKQMIILPDFAFLNSGSNGINGFRPLLFARMDDLIKNDELVRTRLDMALDEKYRMITTLEEKEAHITNFWRMYKPAMTMTTDVGWTPTRDISAGILKEWTAKTLGQIFATGAENITYQAQLLKHHITGEIKKQTPTTRLTLNTSLANGCTPVEFAQALASGGNLDEQINYYATLFKSTDTIRANMNRIRDYTAILKELQERLATHKYVIKMPGLYVPYSEISFDIKLDEDQLKDYFVKYIDNGVNKGEAHLFDPFGQCLISNQLKQDVMAMKYSQSDFERLLKDVYSKNKHRDIILLDDPEHLLDPTKYEASQLVIRLLNQFKYFNTDISSLLSRDLARNMSKLAINLQSALAPKLIEEVHYETECSLKILALVEDYECISGLLAKIAKHKKALGMTINNKLEHCITYLHELLEIVNKTCYDVVLEYLKTGVLSRESLKFQDAKKQYFGLISKIETESQAIIGGILDDMGLSKKEEVETETFLVNLGELKDIKSDYKVFLEKQEKILARVAYTNLDLETERQSLVTRSGMIKKHIRDIKLIASNIKNGGWSGLKSSQDMQDMHLAGFFKYKDNVKLFDKVASIISIYWDIIISLDTGDGHRVIGPDILVSLDQYLFLMMLDSILTMNGANSTRESTLILSSYKVSQDESSVDGTTDDNTTHTVTGFADKMKANQANSRTSSAITDMFEPGAINLEAPDSSNSKSKTANNNNNLPAPRLGKAQPENPELALVPDFGNEPGDEEYEEDETTHIPDFATKLIKSQQTQREILVNFIKDVLVHIKGLEFLYNEMNLNRISEEKARTIERQKRQNLNVFKLLGREGMEDDYRMIQNMRAIGNIDYRNLDETMRQFFGEDYYDAELQDGQDTNPQLMAPPVDNLGDENLDVIQGQAQARHNKLGLDDYEMEEMGFVGADEDMEDQDYGYLAVAED